MKTKVKWVEPNYINTYDLGTATVERWKYIYTQNGCYEYKYWKKLKLHNKNHKLKRRNNYD